MIRGLYTVASGLGAQQARMDVVTNNIANVSTNGYKQDSVMTKPFPEMLLREKTVDNAGRRVARWSPVGFTNQGVAVSGFFTDQTAGILKETGRATDLALSGQGFFAVQANGGELYTRDGQFHTDKEGYLVDSRGNRVLSDSGPVQVGDAEFTVDSGGVITLADGGTYQLRIVEFENPQNLVKTGDNYFDAGNGTAGEAASPGVTQGFLEQSNVDLATQMVQLVEIFRSYEAGQKAIQSQDELLAKAINQVGSVK
ncbi:flagellar basal-body rod protein FlgF [Desulfocucumis palustris]|nr:flagellar basal-body rod protein FlgF [Desulfocucumis palustris]